MRLARTCAAILTGVLLTVNSAAAQSVRIGIPERNNLQYMSFWVAQGAGLFKAEGLDIEVVVPDAPNQSGMILMQKRVDVSLLQPPVYLGLIAEQHPFALFANLLANEPINLIVRGDVAKRLSLDSKAPLIDRLKAIKGLRLGVAPEPPRRLRILYNHVGMNADDDLRIVTRRADDQIDAFTSNAVDALYTHSPVLEDAIVRLGAMLLVNQSGGEVPPLANGQVHTFAATKEFIATHPEVITRVTRAIWRAQQLIHRDPKATITALVNAGIESPSPKHLETIVNLYRAAIPQTPRVSAAMVERNASLYPARPTMPDFSKVRAAEYVDTSFAERLSPAVADRMERFDLGVVEVSASASSELSPRSHVIDGAALRDHQALTVKDAIEYLPGVSVDHKAPRNQAGIAIGGFDSRQVPLHIDGVPAYVPFDGYVDLGRYLTSNVAEVQVAKGYASPLLGPNVLGGVVNIVTLLPATSFEGDGFIGTSAGRQVNAGIQAGGRWRSLSANGSLDRLQSDYFTLSSAFVPTAIQGPDRRVNSAQRDARFRGRAAWAPRNGDQYVLSVSTQRGRTGVPPYAGSAPPCPTGTATSAVPCVTPRFWNWPQWDTNTYYFTSQTGLGLSSSVRLRAFYSDFTNRQEMFDDVTMTSMNLNTSSGILANADHSIGVSGQVETRRLSRNAIAASFFIKEDTHAETTTTVSRTNVATTTPEQRARDRQSSFGLQDAIEIAERVRATVGLSADHLTPLEARDLSADRTATVPFPLGDDVWVFNPVASITYDAHGQGSVFAGFARKSRFPTIKDRYSYRAGRALPNPDLRPERARTWTAGYSRGLATTTVAQVEWHHSHVTEEIENIFFLSPLCSGGGRGGAGSCQQAMNVGAETHHGVSVSVRSSTLPHVVVDANYSYLHRTITSDTTAFPTGTPRHKAIATATVVLPKSAAAIVAVRYNSDIASMSDNGLPLPLATFTTVDAGVRAPLSRGLSLQGGVKNVLDRDVYYWEGFPEPGREAYLTLRYAF